MGSFAYSLHVKCNHASEVVVAVEDAMRDAGYDTTDEQPDEEGRWGMPSPLRALHVSEAFNGWVGVLDSDSLKSASLASDLSRRLGTYTIQFAVNDSDYWYYQLFHHGSQVDEFDSSGGLAGESEMDETSPEILTMFSGGGLAAMQQDIEQRMRRVQQELADAMPDHIRDILQRMQNGSPTQEEIKQYTQWTQTHSQQFIGAINEVMSETIPSVGKPSVPEAELSDHVAKLHPILPSGAEDNRVLDVLGRQAVFAEEVLGEFMKLIGIQLFFANLSYYYLEECTVTELLGADIKVAAHLKFETNAGGTAS